MSQPYSIVEFTQNKTSEIVATKWLNDEEDQCRWPPVDSVKAGKLALKLAEPAASWQWFSVRVLGKAGNAVNIYVNIVVSCHFLELSLI